MAKKNTKMFSEYMDSVIPTTELSVSYNFGNDQSIDIRVRNFMSIDEKGTFVDRVVNSCFDSDDDFHPELRDAVFQITLLQMLTDASVFTKKVPELDENGEPTDKKIDVIDIDKTYNLCRCLNLYAKIDNPVFRSLYDELNHLVAEKIIFRQQRILMGEKKYLDRTKADMENGLALIGSISEKMTDMLSENTSNANVAHAVNEFSKRMENMSDQQLIEAILRK